MNLWTKSAAKVGERAELLFHECIEKKQQQLHFTIVLGTKQQQYFSRMSLKKNKTEIMFHDCV